MHFHIHYVVLSHPSSATFYTNPFIDCFRPRKPHFHSNTPTLYENITHEHSLTVTYTPNGNLYTKSKPAKIYRYAIYALDLRCSISACVFLLFHSPPSLCFLSFFLPLPYRRLIESHFFGSRDNYGASFCFFYLPILLCVFSQIFYVFSFDFY